MRRSTAASWLSVIALAILLATQTGGPANAAAPERAIRDGGSAAVVPDSYIVVLRETIAAAAVESLAHELTARHGGKIGHTFTHALRGFEINVGERAARRMAADPGVAYVQRNGITLAGITQPSPPSWGLDRIDRNVRTLNGSYDYPTAAAGVHAYVIDTGINFDHEDFGGRAISGRDTIDNDDDASDCNGHGTHVAGTIGGAAHGIAKAVTLVAVRIGGCNGSGTIAAAIAGVDWVTANAIHPAVANISFYGGANAAWDMAVENSIASGITYAILAGNGNANNGNPVDACTQSPSRAPNAITVGATNSSDARASFSNFGTCVDIFAPGVGILSTYHTSSTATKSLDGTSMASPHVAGAAAIVLAQNPAFTPAQVRNQLVNLDPTVNAVSNPGTGSPNRLLFVRSEPLRVTLFCSPQTGSYSCNAEAIGAVAPVTYQWSPSQSGVCRITRTISVTVSVSDSLGATASRTTSFLCRARCDRQDIGILCLSTTQPAGSVDRLAGRNPTNRGLML